MYALCGMQHNVNAMQRKAINTWWSATSGILGQPSCSCETDWRLRVSKYGWTWITSVCIMLRFHS